MEETRADNQTQDSHYEKYNNPNPIARYLVNSFIGNFGNFLSKTNEPKNMVEIGAGDGYMTKIVVDKFPNSQIVVTDICPVELKAAQAKFKNPDRLKFRVEDIQKLSFRDQEFDFLVCCEVLEHVQDPVQGLSELFRILKPGHKAILSVPNEPIWRLANMARGKYLSELGNTHGHINHWSSGAFVKLVQNAGFCVLERKNPFPWTMLLVSRPK